MVQPTYGLCLGAFFGPAGGSLDIESRIHAVGVDFTGYT